MIYANHKSQPVPARKSVPLKAMTVLIVVVPAMSIIATLLGIFTMSRWAETAAWHHATQHAIIFLSGVGFGGSLVWYDRTQRSSKNEN